MALKPDYAEACNNRGNALKDLGRAPEALASYERALALRPDYPQALENISILLGEIGRLDEAADAIEAAIALAPTRARSYYLLADMRRLVPGDPHLLAMQNLALDMAALGPDEQIDLHFALGMALADIGDRGRSFQHLIEGNALKRAQTDYDEAAVLRTFEDMPSAFTQELVRAAAGLGDPSEVPIFIVGMPRSGTTLVEQILASLPDVFGAGETGDFSKTVAELNADPVDASASPEEAELIWGRRLQRIGKTYVDRLRAKAPTAQRIVDKTLENYRVMGLIHLALPNARIIHMRRDPVDTCVSCFSKLFVNVPYSYDLGELGRHYRKPYEDADGALAQSVAIRDAPGNPNMSRNLWLTSRGRPAASSLIAVSRGIQGVSTSISRNGLWPPQAGVRSGSPSIKARSAGGGSTRPSSSRC